MNKPVPMISAYSAMVDVPYEEARRRLLLQVAMGELGAKIGQVEPTYAGSWLEHMPEFRLVVAFTTPGGEEIMAKYLQDVPWAKQVAVKQNRYTMKELERNLTQVSEAVWSAELTDLVYATGLNIQQGKVRLYSSEPAVLQEELEQAQILQGYGRSIDDIELVFQATRMAPVELKYPYLLGGTILDLCTAGFVVKRQSDNRRFISTAGHCVNDTYLENPNTGGNTIYFGSLVTENNPEIPTGPRGYAADFQVNNSSVRDFDLTNAVRTNTNTTASVVSYQFKASTPGLVVCKYGKSTGTSCGWVYDIQYSAYFQPGNPATDTHSYVWVYNPFQLGEIACGGDSGAPVFAFVDGGVSGLGVLATAQDQPCEGASQSFAYTPVDEIEAMGYSILTTHFPEYYYQNVFWTETSCTEYRSLLDENGNIVYQTNQSCQTYAPGSGTIESTTGYVAADQLREGIWRGGVGYVRNNPLTADGFVNWNAASWSQCCSGAAPRAQGDYIVGNTYYQNVFWTEGACTEYVKKIDNNGNLIAPGFNQPCRTYAPGSGTIQSYTAYVVADQLREGMWRGNVGYIRSVPLNEDRTDVLWGSAPAWTQCCTGSAPRAQGVFVLNHP